ncbi:RluA family pseudouridine synthase [Pseudobacteroides cellulosolvens]|uniref:Pseudouridine synthase n=1 Tax=Pseudobacteroides cellulosolvens ATCC 35603 = DSM 2933 TaxID=398512 RepID=A0A0L6JM32_9FIRM|nr:RluA family pseudouridine synthase [Pseudobacteroides cellulosolvens]KNY26462.1 pseudouridine synthase, RluA family [Pseudobacteroides cellulosolvens ATCC 35603 = DSM 2933]
MEEIKLVADTMDIRIDSWVSEKLPEYSRTYVKKLIDNESVMVNGKKVKSNYKLKSNDEVTILVPDPVKLDVEAEKIDMDIVYEDKDILVINKPKGMVVHPAVGNYTGTLVNGLMDYCGDDLSDINGVIRPGIVHRIDKDTSGLLVVAKNNISHERLTEMLKSHDIKRVYYAVVDGVIREESGKIDAPIGRHPVDRKKMAVNTKNGRHAVTYFKVLERFQDATLIEVRLETGRTHQIRVHMSYIGFPVMGDEVYGRRNKSIDTDGQVLHAKILEFVHPVSCENMRFEVDLPEYFKEVLKLKEFSQN